MSDLGGDPPCWAHLVEELSESGGAPDPGWFADLGAVSGSGGAVWSLPHGGDLNANLVRLDASGRIGEHINDDVDVLLFVQSGGGEPRRRRSTTAPRRESPRADPTRCATAAHRWA